MGVKINGAIFRNIPGEAEGIDTPSLLVNGQPLSGGTQLYKHEVHFSVEVDGDPVGVDAELITTNGDSLQGEDVTQLSPLSGILTYEYSYCPLLYLDEYSCIFYNVDYQELTQLSVGGTKKFTSDTVTAL